MLVIYASFVLNRNLVLTRLDVVNLNDVIDDLLYDKVLLIKHEKVVL